jgi:ubiquinone/menaquinone biosynthesis C-methylase UbiE
VGIKSGWNVLDAGCGGGSFLPLLAELVGSGGHISTYDLAPENVGIVDSLVENGQFLCSIETRVGNLTSLPYEDNRFDAVWCANITQYLTDDELSQMLAEFCRVVRPEGLVAVQGV